MRYLPLLLLLACGPTPLGQVQTSNPEAEVYKLLDYKGCELLVLRGDRYIYFLVCPDGSGGTAWETVHSNGKTTWTEGHGVQTQVRK